MNPKITFLLQTNYVERLTKRVGWYAQMGGHDVIPCEVTSKFSKADVNAIVGTRSGIVVPYGSVALFNAFRQSSFGQYIQYDEGGYASERWAAEFGDKLLNHAGQRMTAGEARHYLTRQPNAHIRPNLGFKAFIAKVFTEKTWIEHCRERSVADDLQVWLSPVRAIEREYRCWVIDGQVIEIIQYVENGTLNEVLIEEGEIFDVAQHLASIYSPSNAFTLDVAKTPEGYKLIEFNGLHCAGWYAARMHKVMDHYLEMLVKEYAQHPERFGLAHDRIERNGDEFRR